MHQWDFQFYLMKLHTLLGENKYLQESGWLNWSTQVPTLKRNTSALSWSLLLAYSQ